MRMVPQPRGWFVRSGTCVQAAFPSSYLDVFASRPLRSTVVTRFSATVGRSDSRNGAAPRVMDSPKTLDRSTPPGLPGSSADLSPRAVPYHPGEPGDCVYPFLHHRWQASSALGAWPLSFFLTRPNRVRLRYGSRVRLPGLRQRDYSRPRLVGYLLNGQFTG